MGFSIDIDTGGTFTDGFVRGNGRIELVKVPTTPHDLTLCFMECIEEAARKLGYGSASQLLPETDTVRLSTTIGTNALINRSGPKLGLLVTKGAGENAYAGGATSEAVDFLVPHDMIIGIDEEIAPSGASVREPQAAETLAAVKTLLEKGARRIVVSLARAPLNPAHERKVREYVLGDYPAHYLGTVPLLLSTEISSELDDRYRTNASLIDAYIHQEMAHYLYKADEDVRRQRYKYPLLIVHATGGVCRVAKTKAIDTCDSGPAAGIFGAAFLARMCGIENVVTCDIGGTSTDVGLVAHGEPTLTAERTIADVPMREHAIETISIGGGGSSIVRTDAKKKTVAVGPESAGGIPGPACFGLGGSNATVTDAWVTLGYIDPDFFLGGRRKLDRNQARNIIKRRAATPLGVSEEQAAQAVQDRMAAQCGALISDFLKTKGIAPRDATMFAFGGGGGLACPGIARVAGVPRIYLFPFGAQFCAFGSSCTDVVHDYSVAMGLPLEMSDATVRAFNAATHEMTENAYADMSGEGFGKDKVTLTLEAVIASPGAETPSLVHWAPIQLKDRRDVESLTDLYRAHVPASAKDGLLVRELRLKASCHLADPEFPRHEAAGADPAGAFRANRSVFWDGRFQPAPVYDQGKLKAGNVVKGLAIVESVHTTILVPPDCRYTVDEYLNGVMEAAQ